MDMLTPQQELFAHNWVLHQFKLRDRMTATQIAIECGYSPKSAEVSAYRLKKNKRVVALIEKLKENVLGAYTDEAKECLLEWRIIAFFDPRKIHKKAMVKVGDKEVEQTVLMDVLEMGDEAKAIASIEHIPQQDGTVKTKYRFWDKVKVLEMLGKHHKLISDKVEVSSEQDGVVQIILEDNGKGPKPKENV